MKKIVPVLAVLGSAVAFAVYKMKKEEQKQLMDLDEGLLKDDELDTQDEQPIVHEPIQTEVKAEDPQTPDVDIEETEEVEEPMEQEQKPEEPEEPVQVVNEVPPVTETEVQEETTKDDVVYNSEYPHLTTRMVEDIKTMTKEAIAALAKDGDVHEHERPVQHMITFQNKENMESFKSNVINKGFVITKGEHEFDLVVLHISAIDETKLVSSILYLADQAYTFHGEYRGWQSKVSF